MINKSALEKINKISTLHRQLSLQHPALETLYPVAVVENDTFFIYQFDTDKKRYAFVGESPTPMPVPVGVRAAFPLEALEGAPACVVTEEVFDSLAGYVTIFHEFVHCYQYETCESTLKAQLGIAQKAKEIGDFMWEINHPFPYADPDFIQAYGRFLAGVDSQSADSIVSARLDLKRVLSSIDHEYMIWQEWKEGFARWIENRLQCAFDLAVNRGGRAQPFNRVLFYAGGAALMAYLSDRSPELMVDLPALFRVIQSGTGLVSR